MDLYVSNVTNRLDAKGRVSVPAAFRQVLARDGFEGLLVVPALDALALDCGGNALLADMAGVLQRFQPYSIAHDSFASAFYGASEVLKLDTEGRATLSDTLKAHAGISSEVTFVGQGQKFQIWEPGRFRAHLEEARNRLRELRSQLGARAAAEIFPRTQGARE